MAKTSDDVPYQQATIVEQLKAERANAVAYGNEDRVASVDKQLAELGVKRKAAEKRAESAKDDDARKAPEGRSATPPAKQSTAKPVDK